MQRAANQPELLLQAGGQDAPPQAHHQLPQPAGQVRGEEHHEEVCRSAGHEQQGRAELWTNDTEL